ncbi:hypothetical protein NQ176_g4813 [Zarea fungicola]|uniref:Uncharacterized protein n=1 Tax=Zarea fungicola TaxID=93591 RepID=A0ACC1NDV8_9HYPO|nr:hypothetical protein NQ176_g4813 [Lecanicillium fungicola]
MSSSAQPPAVNGSVLQSARHRRLLRDIAEIQQRPYPRIKLTPIDLTQACLVLTPERYPPLHLTISFGDNYPLQAPVIKIQTRVNHPNVFGDYICASILNTTEGYTPAYTLKGICIQMLSFFNSDSIEQVYSGKVIALKDYKREPVVGCGKCPSCLARAKTSAWNCSHCDFGSPENQSSSSGDQQQQQQQQKNKDRGHESPKSIFKSPENGAQKRAVLEASIDSLPDEIILEMLENIDFEDLMAFSQAWPRVRLIVAEYDLIRSRELQCFALWDDLAAVARYRMADAAFAHVWYDSPNDQRSLVLGGLGCALHDLIDIGPDVSCGEVSNIIPSLTGGDLSIEALRSVYTGLVATLEWCASNDPFNTAGLAILFTHWWQLCNLRHRPVALMSRIAPSPEYAVCPEKLTSEPTFAAISHDNGIKFTTGQAVIDDQRAEVERIRAMLDEADVTDLQGLIDKLVIPVLDYVEGKETCLPIEIEYCTDVLQGTMSRRHSEKIHALWALLLVMWKSGAIWMAVIANTQYAHQGMTNCDRGRDDYDATTWGHVEAEPEGAATVADAAPVDSLSTGFSALDWLLSKLRQFILPLNTSL